MKPETLDRYEGLFAPPGRAYDGFLRRRSRKQRNQRIGAFVLAFAIAAGSVAAALAAFHRSSEPKPVNTIDPASVSRLHEIASRLTFPQEGFRMATGDGVLVVGTSRFRSQRGQLITYPFPCGDAGVACMPLWRASLDGAGSPVVANGVVYATGRGGRTLYAFATDCGSNGRECSPRWTAVVGATGGDRHRPSSFRRARRTVSTSGRSVRCSGSMLAAPREVAHARRRGPRRWVNRFARSPPVVGSSSQGRGRPVRPTRQISVRSPHSIRPVPPRYRWLQPAAGYGEGMSARSGIWRSTAARWSSAPTVARRECRPIRSRASAEAHRAGRCG